MNVKNYDLCLGAVAIATETPRVNVLEREPVGTNALLALIAMELDRIAGLLERKS